MWFIRWYIMTEEKRPRVTWTITVDPDLADWMERQIKCRRFGSRSHGIEVCIDNQIQEDKRGKISEEGNHSAPVFA